MGVEIEQRNTKELLWPAIVLGPQALWIIFLIWGHLNLLMVDLPGHIFSAAEFADGRFHQFSDRTFDGVIHGLFYPPLESAILSSLHYLIGFVTDDVDWFVTFRVYLSALVVFLFVALTAIGLEIKSHRSRILFWILFSVLFHWEKSDRLFFQGLGVYDLLVTGLSSQVLSFCFLLLLLVTNTRQDDSKFLIRPMLMAGVVLSHLVTSIVMALFLICLIVFDDRRIERLKSTAFEGLWALGLSAFFWIPFVAHREFLTSSMIVTSTSYFFLAWLVLGLLGSSPQNRGLWFLSILLYFPTTLLNIVPNLKSLAPHLHFYRFEIYSAVVSLFGFALDLPRSSRKWLTYAGAICGTIFLIQQSRIWNYDPNSTELTYLPIRDRNQNSTSPQTLADLGGRYWIIDGTRPIDVGLDVQLMLSNDRINSSKGLYWESHRSHVLVSTYLRNLLGRPIVLDHTSMTGIDCRAVACLVEKMAIDYGLAGIIVGESSVGTAAFPNDTSDLQAGCLKEVLRSGTPALSVRERFVQLRVSSRSKSQRLFSFDLRSGSNVNPLAMVEAIDPRSLKPIDLAWPKRSDAWLSDLGEACSAGTRTQTVFFDQHEMTTLTKLEANHEIAKSLTIERKSRTEFEIQASGGSPSFFKLKYAYLPGVKLLDEKNRELTLVESLPGMVGYGTGRMRLIYTPTPPMKLGYGVSIFTLLLAPLALAIRRNWVQKLARTAKGSRT